MVLTELHTESAQFEVSRSSRGYPKCGNASCPAIKDNEVIVGPALCVQLDSEEYENQCVSRN